MAASDHLSTGLFHGSTVPLNVGDIIVPATKAGHSRYKTLYKDYDEAHHSVTRGRADVEVGHSRGDHVYMATSEEGAWRWAKPSAWERDSMEDHPVPEDQRSPRVYEVEPIGGAHVPEDVGVPGGTLIPGERVTARHQGARVIREHVIPPPEGRNGGVQGQIPGVNWDRQDLNEWPGGQRQIDLEREQPHARKNLRAEAELANPTPPRPSGIRYDSRLPGII